MYMHIEKSRILRVLRRALDTTVQRVRNFRIRKRRQQYVKYLAKSDADIKLDLGCGLSRRPGFIGIDISLGADIQWDIRCGLPFKDNTVLEIRSDHFFEHLELSVVVKVLRECRRVLVACGVLDFTVPHIDPYIEAYLHKNFNYLKEKICDIPLEQEALYGTCFDLIVWLLYRSGEHKALFDKESILAKVKLAGFENVTTREFDPAKDGNYRFSSIYIVAIK